MLEINSNPQTIVNRLHADLLKARKARDTLTSTTLQAVIAAIDNAGAVPIPENTDVTEMPRRETSAQDIQAIIKDEITELQHSIDEIGDNEVTYSNELKNKMVILKKYLHDV